MGKVKENTNLKSNTKKDNTETILMIKNAITGAFREVTNVFTYAYSGFVYIITLLVVVLPQKLAGKKVDMNAINQGEDNLLTKDLSFGKKEIKVDESKVTPYVLKHDGSDAIKHPQKVTYKYLVKDTDGKFKEGYFAAFSVLDVFSYLNDEGMIPYNIETNKQIQFFHSNTAVTKKKMKTKDLVFWLAQLSTYVKAGIPLTDGVKILAQQDKRAKYKPIYESVIYELTMGEPFSEALNRQGNAFPPMLVNTIKSAEMVGNIEKTLDEMSDYYQEMEDTKKAIVSAISYPAIVMFVAIIICVFMLTYIVPKFVEVYESMNAEINPITQFCLDLSDFLRNNGFVLLAVIILAIMAFIYFYKNLKSFRKSVQQLCMKIPVVGKIIISKEMSSFSRTFATLQKNNVLLTDSIDILAKITGNEIYKEVMFKTIDNLTKGGKMSEVFKDSWAIPDVAYFMMVTGESTGELAEMLDKIADFYHKEERQSVAMIKTFIEPVMILFLAFVVGFILIAVLVPMFGIYGSVA
ncbi:MAG: type II secretion system F family protein [Bacilli bacterium]|jgi:type IV pilus assembly protein PilC|nr:type II secretion system F family protein [Bacilli bacterium]